MSDWIRHVHMIGTSAHHRVVNAATDAGAVAEATDSMSKMVELWADADERRRQELWSEAAHASDALYERFRERIQAEGLS